LFDFKTGPVCCLSCGFGKTIINNFKKNRNKMSTTKKVAIGVDVGGTNTAIGVVDPEGNVMIKDNIPTATHGNFEKFIEDLATAIKGQIASAKLLNENL